MTKKDYIEVAKAIKKLKTVETSTADVGYNNGIRDTMEVLCSVFKRDNPRFDKDKFLEACGLN